jgi:hypothetical protein
VKSATTLETQLKARYTALPPPGGKVPRYLQVQQWIHFSEQYLAAAEYLSTRSVPLFGPWFQLVGHAMECSLKAYLRAVRVDFGKGHDLVRITDLALKNGLKVHEHDVAMIVHVNHMYSSDLRSGTRFKSRYPNDRTEYTGASVPSQERLTAIVNVVTRQAAIENDLRNAPKPTQPLDTDK